MRFASVSAVAAILIWSTSTGVHAAKNYCGELENAFGPFDYVNAKDRENLEIVERHHFTTEVEHLIRGITGSLGGDIHYTLMVFPNHHRALVSMGKLALREKTPRPAGARFSAECYFERAIRFRPGDGVARMVYGNFLATRGEPGKALEQLKQARRLEPENANINYSLGLLYFKKKDYAQANIYARKAYALGYPSPWLKNKLAEAGKWDDKQAR